MYEFINLFWTSIYAGGQHFEGIQFQVCMGSFLEGPRIFSGP